MSFSQFSVRLGALFLFSSRRHSLRHSQLSSDSSSSNRYSPGSRLLFFRLSSFLSLPIIRFRLPGRSKIGKNQNYVQGDSGKWESILGPRKNIFKGVRGGGKSMVQGPLIFILRGSRLSFPSTHTFQLEISRKTRSNHQNKMSKIIP